jgi:ParB-like chromosome segregation protein Spo0J
MKINCSYQKMIPVEQLIAHDKNANKHSENQIRILAKILNYQGWRHPIVVSGLSGKIVAGHCRLAAAKLNGWPECPVDVQMFDDAAQELAFLLSDNIVAELAETDAVMLEELSINLGDGFDHELLGLTDPPITELNEIKNTSEELDIASFDNFQHQCPKCGFEWNDNGTT